MMKIRYYCRYHGLTDKEACPVCHANKSSMWEVKDDVFVIADGPCLVKYIGKQGKVVVPNNICILTKEAFKDNNYVKEVILPNRIYVIKEETFANCASLNKITLPSELERIECRAFYNCASLESITIPKNILDISVEAFYGSSIKTITFLGTKDKWKFTRFYGLSSGVIVHCADGDIIIND